jgi:polyhydroxybutyrate depolymerase
VEVGTGWQNGPATPEFYGGTEDITFVEDLLAEIDETFCVDTNALFATGHSWGGEFSAVLGCFMAERVLGIVPVAANRPYYLPNSASDPPCTGNTAAWVFHSKNDNVFPLSYSQEQLDFWLTQNDCGDTATPLLPEGAGSEDDCGAFNCNGPSTRACWYDGALGHAPPLDYYPLSAVTFFQDLL